MANKLLVVLACSFFWYSAEAQPATEQGSAAGRGSQTLVVYVEDFSQDDTNSDRSELVDYHTPAAGLIQLRLLEVPSLTVRRATQAPPCGGQPSPGKPLSQMQVSQAPQAGLEPSGEFYVVRGTVRVRLPDMVLDYFVDECDGQSFKRVFQDTKSAMADHVLEQLTIAAQAIALGLVKSVPRTRVVVAFESEGEADQKKVQAEVRRRVEEAISESSDLQVADTGDYTVGGRITLQKQNFPFPLFTKSGTVEGELFIQSSANKYPLPAVSKSRRALPDFYTEGVKDIQQNLTIVVLAEKRGWTDLRGTMEIKALLARGNALLDKCPKTAPICKDAQDAIPLLIAAVEKDPEGKNPEGRAGLWMLGRAQFLAREYTDAAKSLERARSLLEKDREAGKVVPPKDETDVLNLLGDAYRSLRKYTEAQSNYDASLKIIPSQPDVYVRSALALRSSGKRLEALQSVLQGLQLPNSQSDSQALHTSAKDVIRSLRPEEFAVAEKTVAGAFEKSTPLADEYALVISRKEGQILSDNWTTATAEQVQAPLQRALDLQPSDPDVRAEIYANLARIHLLDRDFQKLDLLLTQAEKLPPTEVSADNREWVARIRARYWMNQKEYAKAYASADAARQIRETYEGDFTAAEATLGMAQDKEKAARGTPEQKAEFAKLYQQAIELATPLVDRRFGRADYVYIEANHALGLDADTLKKFDSLVRQDPRDNSALNGLMFVCSQYLFDFECAFAAAEKDAALHDPNAPDAADAYVNLGEVAILDGSNEQARDWLGVALKQPNVAPREKSLAHLYRLWLDMRQGQKDQSLADFQSWQAATEQFRQANVDLNWLFLGARKALKDSQIGEKQKELLAAMMDALEDTSRPLPGWLESVVPYAQAHDRKLR